MQESLPKREPFDYERASAQVHRRKRPLTPAERRARRRKRRMKQILCIVVLLLIFVLFVSLVTVSIKWIIRHFPRETTDINQAKDSVTEVYGPPAPVQEAVQPELPPEEIVDEPPVYQVSHSSDTLILTDQINSEFAVLIDAESGKVIAAKNADTVMYPASMTKVLTLLTAVEHIADTSSTFTMTREIGDYCFKNGCSIVGYEVDEVIPIEELFYGCILSSGADACLGLAEIAAGSHEAFVELMNQKIEELGLSDTAHFTNCVGLHDKEHYCTVSDLAVMLHAAMQNEKCREVLSTRIFKTSPTPFHTVGQDLSNWFIRRIEDRDTGALTVKGGKTGYVQASGSCAASFAEDENGNAYICVTGKANSKWRAIDDHAVLYKDYSGVSPAAAS